MSEPAASGNRLAAERSRYLLQHARNPVDWHPWGAEALELARREDRPIFLSIGYSACHWCHVMERESFEDAEVARAMEGWVAIKVDREERPDVDELYMSAAMLIAGRGGWPLTAFCTPDARPFYAGTYFPKLPRQGMPGLTSLLTDLRTRYQLGPSEIEGAAREVTAALSRLYSATTPREEPSVAHSERGCRGLVRLYDPAYGGFGGAPKFPQALALRYLLAYHRRTRDATALEVVDKALEGMARGGIHDHLGGGFHRYAVDERWAVPHFEKMLYDQAMLAPAYTEAAGVLGRDYYLEVASRTLDFVLNDLRAPDGAFFASQDADVEGVEGKFWVWSADEVERLLSADEAAAVTTYYGISPEGNFEGANVLRATRTPEQAARYLRLELPEFETRLASGRTKLIAAREERARPGTDTKAVASWNGLMIEALAEAYLATRNSRYLEAATTAARLLLGRLAPSGELRHVAYDGEAHVSAFADDYALLAVGLMALYRATNDECWLTAARGLIDQLLARFWEPEASRLLYVPREGHGLIMPITKTADAPTPSASAWAARALVQLSRALGEPAYRDRASALLSPLMAQAAEQPLFMGAALLATEDLLAAM